MQLCVTAVSKLLTNSVDGCCFLKNLAGGFGRKIGRKKQNPPPSGCLDMSGVNRVFKIQFTVRKNGVLVPVSPIYPPVTWVCMENHILGCISWWVTLQNFCNKRYSNGVICCGRCDEVLPILPSQKEEKVVERAFAPLKQLWSIHRKTKKKTQPIRLF